MFKLQRLEITGFKSFADHTEIVFTGNGITAIVGPNGCGKSNISESIAWVLGEQRAKQLRGSEMKDVVFQGTSKRKPAGMAEVVLHLVRDEETFFYADEENLSEIDEVLNGLDENTAQIGIFDAEKSENPAAKEIIVEKVQAAQVGTTQIVEKKIKARRHWQPRSFALDFAPGEAVSVTRRLYLSGESEYLLNGKACRLRDIQDLFAGTGLSGAHYAIIEQGRIGQILSAKPSDRRNLIEEAAGISKFRTRQRAAELRLETAKVNLNRISDIISEIEKQANVLRRQAAKTRRYKILREELRSLLKNLFTAEGKLLTELTDELEEKLAKAVQAERKAFAKVAEKDEAFRQAMQKARKAEENLSELRQKHAENALTRDRCEREKTYRQEQIQNLEMRSLTLKNDIENSQQRLRLFKAEIERLKKDEQKELEESAKIQKQLQSAEQIYKSKMKELREIEAELEAIRSEVFRHTSAKERFAEIKRQIEATEEKLKERAEGLKREHLRAEETFAEHTRKVSELEQELRGKRQKTEALHLEKQKLLLKSGEARNALQVAEKALNKLQNEFSRKKNRFETLQELDEKRAVYAPAVQKLFAEQEKIGVKFRGVVADFLNVEEKAEKAIENLFGTFLQSVIVETESEARQIVKYLKDKNFGRISIIVFPNSVAQSSNQKTVTKHQSAIAGQLGISDRFAEFLSEIFPREMSADFVESVEEIKTTSSLNLIDKSGDMIFGGKLFVSGKVQSEGKNSSLLAFKRELRELEEAIKQQAIEIESATQKVSEARDKLAETEDQIVDLQSLIVQVERDLLSLEIQLKTAQQETERAERHQKIVEEEIRQIQEESAEIESRRQEAGKNIEKAEKNKIDAEEKFEKVLQKLNAVRAETEVANAVLNEKRTLAATGEERRRGVQNALRRVENEFREHNSRLSAQNLELNEIGEKCRALTASITELTEKIELAEAEQDAEEKELAAATENLQKARETADAMSEELAELNRKSAEARNERATLEIRQTEAVTKLRSLNENCLQELNLSLLELVENEEVPANFDLEQARQRVAGLREKLENFGAINMLAVEELSEVEERLLFLTSQRQDIIDSIDAAEEALNEIKKRSRERFRQAFEAINANFMEFFRELFGGGRGEMTLLEAEDILEAGIEVIAQPPGKRLQNILLLSGGEKAMAAIALILAIFKYRPSPFCLLDEVDAPLDDANVGRFVDKIAQMAEKTQFIIITHNKRTMEAARALYGVTMQEAGVSQVVSVRFE
jgi:chromosome segregation protein